MCAHVKTLYELVAKSASACLVLSTMQHTENERKLPSLRQDLRHFLGVHHHVFVEAASLFSHLDAVGLHCCMEQIEHLLLLTTIYVKRREEGSKEAFESNAFVLEAPGVEEAETVGRGTRGRGRPTVRRDPQQEGLHPRR